MSAANAAPDERPLFAAVLKPHRSLAVRGLLLVMIALAAMSLGVGTLFWTLGAWPVPGFLGLDVVLLYVAFRLSYRQARAAEEIQLSRSVLTVRRIAADG